MRSARLFLGGFSFCHLFLFSTFYSAASLLYLSYVLYVFVHSVKYEDPQALGGLASALDVRQQNTGGVSTLIHVV